MKNWRLALLAAVAALGLQACDVQVHTADTKVQPPQATLPEDTQLHAPATTTAAAAPPVEPATTVEATTIAQAPVQPDTAALGASGASPDAGTTSTATQTAPASAGSAAPTELQRFFEANEPKASATR
jgi:hypothetical protein